MSDPNAPQPSPSTDVPPFNGQTLPTRNSSERTPLAVGETLAPREAETPSCAATTGQMIAGYLIEGEIGRGGMGVVYKARQPGLHRMVALKMILHADHAGTEDRLRFLREAESLGKLHHENIVQVYEVGEHEGKPFISLEYVEGGSLDQYLKGTPLPPREAARLVQQLAAAMQTAHDVGIIHRDLKPANVLLASGGRKPPVSETGEDTGGLRPPLADTVAKITDFGLAKRQGEGGLSVSGAVMGTPSYMAPEQAAGKVKATDARTDVYALGAILYECLTGRPPFRAASALDTMMQVMKDEPVSVRSLQPTVPGDLETICLKCLQKEPGRRYQSAREMADDLDRYERGEPVLARPIGRLERGWRWCRRNPAVASLLGTVALLLVLGTIISTTFGIQTKQALAELTIKEREERTAKEREKAARGEVEQAQVKIKQALENETTQRKAAERLLYSNRLTLAQIHWNDGNVAAARDTLEDALQIRIDETQNTRDTWEHRYLYTMMNHRGQRTYLGHTSTVNCVAFSPDGSQLASASWDKEVKLWDLSSGQDPMTLIGHSEGVSSVAYSPDGKRLVSVGWDQKVKVWDTLSGQNVLTLLENTRIICVAFSPDGKHIVLANQNGTIKVCDGWTGQKVSLIEAHTAEVNSVAYSPDGKRLASGSFDSTVKVWEPLTGKNLLTIKASTTGIQIVAFSPDGRRLASASGLKDDKTVNIWDASTGLHLLTLKGNTSGANSLAFSPDGRWLATTVGIWDATSGQNVMTFKGHTLGAKSVVFSPDGRRLASAGVDGLVKLWDVMTASDGMSFKCHTEAVIHVAFSPDGKQLASASGDKMVKVWDVALGQNLLTLKGHSDIIREVAFSPNGKRLASSSKDKTVKVWDAVSGQDLLTLKRHSEEVNSVVFSSDGKRIITGSGNSISYEPGEIKVWDATSGQDLRTFKGHTGCLNCVAFSPDDKLLASASTDRTVKVWDASSCQNLMTFKGHTGQVYSVAFSPDGRKLASSSLDQTVKVWDMLSGQELLTLKGHREGWVRQVVFSPDGKRLASASKDLTVKVWDATSGQDLLTLKGHTGPVTSVAFSPDGLKLASASWDKTIKVWDASTNQNVLTLNGNAGWVGRVCFSPDSRRLASLCENKTVKVWDTLSGRELLTLKENTKEVYSLAFSHDGKRLITVYENQVPVSWDLATGLMVKGANDILFIASPRSPDGRLFANIEGDVIRLHRLPEEKEKTIGWRWWVDPDYRWHREKVDETWQEGDWFGAAFHAGRLLEERPWDGEVHLKRAYALSQLEKPTEAAIHALRAILLDPHVRCTPPTVMPQLVMPRVAEGN